MSLLRMTKKIWLLSSLCCSFLGAYAPSAVDQFPMSALPNSEQWLNVAASSLVISQDAKIAPLDAIVLKTPVHTHCCCVLSPHMLNKIEAYAHEHGIAELMELVETTRAAASHHVNHYRVQKIDQLKERRRDLAFSSELAAFKSYPLPEPIIKIYDARGMQTFGLPWNYQTYTFSKQEPSANQSKYIKEGLKGMFATLNFYWQNFQWNSIDGKGIPLKAVVNYGKNYFNAYFDGSKEVFGNPGNDPQLAYWFGSFTNDIDIAAHELTHGVTEYKVGLIYEGQSGAINEHMSDVFGIQVKHYYYHQHNMSLTTEAKWKVGDSVLKDVQGRQYALRDMLHPGQGYLNHPMLGDDPQPASFQAYQPLPLSEDNGGVHIYSGPLNCAFANVVEDLKENSWERAGSIWYHAYEKLTPDATFIDLANATIQIAYSMYGDEVALIVRKAWDTIAVWGTGAHNAVELESFAA